MQMHEIGRTTVSRIGIGCWSFGGGEYWGAQSQREVERIVRSALEEGVNFFDTARMYNDGASEKSLGQALEGVRHKAIVCSKVSPAKSYRDTLRYECEQSLKNLGTDYIDIYMMHWPANPMGLRHFTDDEAVLANPPAAEETFLALEELRKEGKIREIGLSNYGLVQMREAISICPEIAVNELPYNIISRAIEAEIMPFCMENGISVVSSMTLQQGVLAGIYDHAEDIPPSQAHSRHFKQERGQGASRHNEEGAEDEVFETVAVLKRLAAGMDVTPAQLSIAWALNNSGIACALVGSRSEDELAENIGAARLSLAANVLSEIDAVSQKVLAKLGRSPDYYENSSSSRIY